MTRAVADDGGAITVGRYQLHGQIARGGMATIHLAHLRGDVGFSRIVAAKRLHPELALDREFVAMFLDEAKIASKVHHRNVVPVLDVVTIDHEVVLVQDYVHGVPLQWLLKSLYAAKEHVPISVAVSIACQVLAGLHAAHETLDEMGKPLEIIHRDVSPQNVMIATDGTARLLDFGVAKAAMVRHVTRAGVFKGKVAYSAPEHIRGSATRQSDIYSLSVVLWELLVGQRLHDSSRGKTQLIEDILTGSLPSITEALEPERSWLGSFRWSQLEALASIIQTGLAGDVAERWATAADMEAELARTVRPASGSVVATWVKVTGAEFLAGRDKLIAAEEARWRTTPLPERPSRRSPPTGDLAPIGAAELPEQARWLARLRRVPALYVAVIALLTCVVGLGVVLAVHGGDATRAVVAPSPISPAGSPLAAVSSSPLEATVPVRCEVAVEPPPVVHHVPARSPPPPLRSRSQAHVTQPPPAEMSTAPAVAPPCNPPYYFKGAKKVFKPACL